MAAIDLILAAAGGSGSTFALQLVTGWWKTRSDDHKTDRDADINLEKHRDQLTFDLLTAAREEMSEMRAVVATHRQLSARAAHLEEALDHLHAWLHADGAAELRAAERRARAFLRRMRPEIGDLRNEEQRARSERERRERLGLSPDPVEGDEK